MASVVGTETSQPPAERSGWFSFVLQLISQSFSVLENNTPPSSTVNIEGGRQTEGKAVAVDDGEKANVVVARQSALIPDSNPISTGVSTPGIDNNAFATASAFIRRMVSLPSPTTPPAEQELLPAAQVHTVSSVAMMLEVSQMSMEVVVESVTEVMERAKVAALPFNKWFESFLQRDEPVPEPKPELGLFEQFAQWWAPEEEQPEPEPQSGLWEQITQWWAPPPPPPAPVEEPTIFEQLASFFA